MNADEALSFAREERKQFPAKPKNLDALIEIKETSNHTDYFMVLRWGVRFTPEKWEEFKSNPEVKLKYQAEILAWMEAQVASINIEPKASHV